MNEQTKIFVKVDLLIHKKGVMLLQDFMRNSKSLKLKDYDYIDYSLKKDKISINSTPSISNAYVIPSSFQEKLKNRDLLLCDYILLTIASLQKLLSKKNS